MELPELFKLFDVRLEDEDEDSVTVGGFISDSLGAVPENGNSFVHRGIKITVDSVTDRRVDTATVELVKTDE